MIQIIYPTCVEILISPKYQSAKQNKIKQIKLKKQNKQKIIDL